MVPSDVASGRARSSRLRYAAVALMVAMSTLVPVPGAAQRLPDAPADYLQELAKLQKQADALSKEYHGELLALDDARGAARTAAENADRLTREWTAARADVARLAAAGYMSGGGLDVIPLLVSDDPADTIRNAAVVEHLNRDNSLRMQGLQTLAEQAARSRRDAEAKLAEVAGQLRDLEGQRGRVRTLLARYQAQRPRPDGVTGARSPIIGNRVTARMRGALLAVDGRFGPFPAIGCYRAGDTQDHGTGKACDFMESTNGRMPSVRALAHGDAVAQYAIENALDLGIKYVIWKQRIWDIRSGSGWQPMADRGSITQNHFDHVHISVL